MWFRGRHLPLSPAGSPRAAAPERNLGLLCKARRHATSPRHACCLGFPWNYSSLSPADGRSEADAQASGRPPPAARLVMSLLSTDGGLLGSSRNARAQRVASASMP